MGADETMNRHRFSTDDYHRMGEAGILGPDDRVELIEGEIIRMAPIGGPHVGIVNTLATLFARQLFGRAVVSVQNPVVLPPYSEPQPDLALLKWEMFKQPLVPGAADVLLVVEVAQSSLTYDRDIKVGVYARHGIPETWLIDVANRTTHVFRNPTTEGYRDAFGATPADTIAPQLLPDVTIALAELW